MSPAAPVQHRARRLLIFAIVATAFAMLVLAAARSLAAPNAFLAQDEPPLVSALWQGAMLGFLVVGAVVAVKRPVSPLGWAMLAIPVLLWAGFALGVEGAVLAERGAPAPRVMVEAVWLLQSLQLPGLVAVAMLLLLAFPSGELDRAGRRTLRAVTPLLVLWIALRSVMPGPLYGTEAYADGGLMNPHGWARLSAAGAIGEGAAAAIVPIVLLASAWNLARRYRATTGIERQQFRWVARAITLAPLALAGMVLGELLLPGPAQVVTDLAAVWIVAFGIAAAIGASILRYRLWDIDRVVSRTLSYAAVTLILLITYLGLVVGLRVVIGPFAGESDVAIAVSTLAVAALFQPLRRRIQALVDRRFNRARYDAGQMAAAFAGRLRDEFETRALVDELQEVVATALQPVGQSVWIAPRGTARGPSGGSYGGTGGGVVTVPERS
jgi:hypothetical protein